MLPEGCFSYSHGLFERECGTSIISWSNVDILADIIDIATLKEHLRVIEMLMSIILLSKRYSFPTIPATSARLSHSTTPTSYTLFTTYTG